MSYKDAPKKINCNCHAENVLAWNDGKQNTRTHQHTHAIRANTQGYATPACVFSARPTRATGYSYWLRIGSSRLPDVKVKKRNVSGYKRW